MGVVTIVLVPSLNAGYLDLWQLVTDSTIKQPENLKHGR